MSNEILKEFIVALGFKVDESGAKRSKELITGVEKQLVANEKAARDRDGAEKARQAAQQLRASETAAMLRVLGVNVAAFATAAAAAMGAVALAIKNSLGEFDKLYYASGRTGASVNNLKALGYAFKQTGSSAEAALSAVDNFARARRSNPGLDAMLRGYGIDTKGDTSDVLMNSIEAIRKKHPQFAGEQVAGLLGISPDEYDHLIRYRTEIARFTDEYKKLQGAMGVNGGETATAAKEIMRQFGRLSAVVEVFADKVTQTVAPAIEFLATKLGSLVEFITDEDKRQKISAYFDPIIGATKTLVKWVSDLYDMFVKVFDYVRNSPFGKLLGAINPGFIRDGILSALQPTSAEASEGGGGGGGTGASDKPGLLRRGVDAVKRGLGLGAKADKTDYKFDGAKAEVLKQAAKELGTSPEDLATVISYESKFRPNVWGGKGGRYMGLIQFGPNERRDYGANDKQSFAEQMPAVVRYLKSRGFKPGMGLNQLYATINGGNPYKSQNASDGYGTIASHVEKMRVSEAARVKAFLNAKTEDAPAPVAPRSTPRFQMNPGGFDFRDYMNSAPMGSTSNVDNRRSAEVKIGDTNVTIHGSGDAGATAASFKRAQQDIDGARLRDFQTVIR